MSRLYRRRSFIAGLALASGARFLAGCVPHARSRRVPRLGFLTGNAPSLVAAFTGELRRLGYVDHENIVLETRLQRPNTPDLDEQAAELARMGLDLVVAGALPQALAVREANPRMPMVIATCPGMVSNGFAESLERPGGIYTGIDELPPGVTARRLELLKAAAPALSRIALLSTTPGRGGHETQLADAERAAPRLGVTVHPYRATTQRELEAALEALLHDGMDGLVNFQGGLSLANRRHIADFAAIHRRPAIYQSEFFIEAGGLMTWAPDQEEQYREAARYADRILRGARPGDLPVRYPTHYALTLNTGAAFRLGLTLPPALLAQAERVVP